MPELPEVEITRRSIAPHVERQIITSAHFHDRRLRWPVPRQLHARLIGRRVERIERRGKYLLFHTEGGALLCHLGMTGTLRIHSARLPLEPHIHAEFQFSNGIWMRYRDPRRFGAMIWAPAPVTEHKLLARLGPEPFSTSFEGEYLYRITRSRSSAIKSVIMDNRVVVGVGNIYANEALFRARIRPTRSASRLGRDRLSILVTSIRDTLADAIAAGGSTLRDYVDSFGQPGTFQLGYSVYGRSNLPCQICRTIVRVERTGGRATYYCPVCQR